ncbi:MAG: hybrid sensor histidine kinase/response regulator [Gammaproteobacteria bacterium RIFOXYD12_FULL_61_37]|nr:MAG: hybrid sensor histidine kinase/response regulator [Gammaproteobacteria bacterium RIFOXYD12_FULL_61_37]
MAEIQNTSSGFIDPRLLLTVLDAYKKGDFSQRLPADWTGLPGKVADTLNDIIEQANDMVGEFGRVSQAVGKQGKVGERIDRQNLKGGWGALVDSSNALANDLVSPMNEMIRVVGAVAEGDLGQAVPMEIDGLKLQGQFLKSAEIVNTMVVRLATFSSEVTRVAREVGTEGKLGGQAEVKGVSGTWKDLTDSVNGMATNLTTQVRNIAQVTTAVANGDLTKKITVEAKGEILELKSTVNIMVDQLSTFASEVTRVAREVGTEGKLGGQAEVAGVGGTWRDLTESVNGMASNLTTQVRNIAYVTTSVANGDLGNKITAEAKGEILQLKETINIMVDQLGSFASEVTRVAREVGTEGKLGGQAEVRGVSGTWKDLTEGVNGMAANLTSQVRNIAQVTTAVANGELTKKITVDARGEILELKDTINTMVDQLSSFGAEVTRVAREVGTEGKLGGQAAVAGVSGTWKDLTDSVNGMASNLTGQVRNIADVTTAVARGDLSKKITAEAKGEILELKNTINIMVDQLSSFGAEVTRVAREVGTEGKLGGQAAVEGVSGTWKDLTDSVNFMASNLTGQVRNIADVSTAIANGDLSRKITAEAKGEILQLKETINIMVDQLSTFADEVTRVAREVGSEGKLGGQAEVAGVGGTWKDLTDSVNGMAANLTSQVRNIADVTTAVAKGDLTRSITVEAKGEIFELKNTINIMVDQLSTFADEVTRVAREVGTEGKLGGQGQVPGVAGTWKDLTDSVNGMAANLTSQVRNIADVTTAVANGDLTKKITVDARGEILELKSTINVMVDQLQTFGAEVTRVAREVGTEGKLGGQATVAGVSGTWKDLTDSVNGMASNLTGQVRNIAEVTIAVANGDLSRKITVDVRGEFLQLKETINGMVDQLRSFASEVTRVAREVGVDGKLGGQAYVSGVAGTWKDLTDSVNGMASNLTSQVRNIAQVTTAVASGDLSKKITVDVKGEILELKNTVNVMVDQLNSFAAEVTRVAREVGTEGKLGGQGAVRGVSGTWKDLTDNVNFMAANLTQQVRGIAKVVTAVANGDLKKLTVEAKGEIAELADTINNMTDTLALFADQVTSVAREVGVEGKLGGQASVPGAAGTWKDLTDNVNGLAANLTNQVRAIADVATAVTKGDLTRNVQVEAKGEVADLKDNVNEMIRNLRETTRQNSEQDWLKSNLAKFTRLLQGQRDLAAVSKMVLSELAPLINGQHGIFYIMDETQPDNPRLRLTSAYAFHERKNLANEWRLGEGLVGQAAVEKQRILLTNVPSDYIEITSGLGESRPQNIIVLPIVFEGKVKAVIEMASFTLFSPIHQNFLDQLGESIGIVLNTIEANMRTEELLKQSQSLAEELGSQQEELRQTNEELEDKARLLEEQKVEVERKNREVESAKYALEEKAEQLSLTSKYKSEFLSNMSHELRTPLNSLLILAQQLAENPKGNLDDKQVEFARTIQGSGKDLLGLINEILDLSKIESGTVTLDIEDVTFAGVREQIERTFRHVAENRGLVFDAFIAPALPPSLFTDEKRLQQVLKNLLSNALKFTEKGSVTVRMDLAGAGWSVDHAGLNSAGKVVAFYVTDTGVGVAADKQKIIFEAFQQADSGTARKYGGTGLGLSISREIARLLGGELRLIESVPGKGSTFALFLPLQAPSGAGRQRSERGTLSTAAQEPPPRQAAATQETPFERRAGKLPQDDRAELRPGDRSLLIVEDDPRFAAILLQAARDRGFKGICADRGGDALRLAAELKPTAITLDIHLPDIDGWVVLERLKNDAATRHIPVEIISVDDNRPRGLRFGAFEYLVKPVTAEAVAKALNDVKKFAEQEVKDLLVVDGDEAHRKTVLGLIGNGDVRIKAVTSAREALAALRRKRFDCVVVDRQLPDMSAIELLQTLQGNELTRDIPIIVYGAGQLAPADQEKLKVLAAKGIVKDVQTPERLLDETALFLHRLISRLPPDRRKMLEKLHAGGDPLAGKKVLVVDDDVRNIFALTAALERQKMDVISAENGKTAIEILKKNPDTHVVLMDIMMPEMDGFETMRRIRALKKFESLPMIALTAKAMKGDREKCIEAGASDYVSKPVDIDQLLTLLRVWLSR